MANTHRVAIYGRRPPCAINEALIRRHLKAKKLQSERLKTISNKTYISYPESEEEDFDPRSINFSSNVVDYLQTREQSRGNRHLERASISNHFATERMITKELFKEHVIPYRGLNSILCSEWLNSSQVLFGTKCSKLYVYDVKRGQSYNIPTMGISRNSRAEPSAIQAVSGNPSRSLMATSASCTGDVAVYQLPTLQPCILGKNRLENIVTSLCWLDDRFLASSFSGYNEEFITGKVALWRVSDEIAASEGSSSSLQCMQPIAECELEHQARAMVFNKTNQELVAISGSKCKITIIRVETCRKNLMSTVDKNNSRDYNCLAVHENDQQYAIGCYDCAILVDPRSLHETYRILLAQDDREVTTISYQGDVVTLGTSHGNILFYDVRSSKCMVHEQLHSEFQRKIKVYLKASPQRVTRDGIDGLENGLSHKMCLKTHCYDPSGTKLWVAGGILSDLPSIKGVYASLWQ